MSMSDRSMTAAESLNSFRAELIEGGYSPDEAASLARLALPEMLRGFVLFVRDDEAVSA